MSEGPCGGKDSRLGKDPLAPGREEPAADAAAATADGQAAPWATPDGSDAYALYQRGLDLLGRGSAAAAAQLFGVACGVLAGACACYTLLRASEYGRGLWRQLRAIPSAGA